MSTLIDSHPEANYDLFSIRLDDITYSSGQSLICTGGILDSCKFYLKKTNSPTGNIYAKLYNHSGEYGVSGIPTGSAIATSDALTVSDITTGYTLITFTFSGANKIFINSGDKYVIAVSYQDGDATNYVSCGIDYTDSTHPGNICFSEDEVTWTHEAYDLIFYIYKEDGSLIHGVSTITGINTITL